MIKRLIKYLSALLVLLLLILVGAAGLLLGWVGHEPRSVPELTPYIERALSSPEAGIEAHIGETWLKYSSWKHPLDIHLQNINITRAGSTFTSFSEIALRLDLLSLPFGQILPSAITVSKPSISLFQNKDRSISFGFGEFDFSQPPQAGEEKKIQTQSMIPVSELLAYVSSSSSSLRKLRYLKILDADATIGSLSHGQIFEVTGVDITAKRSWRGDIRVIAGGSIEYEGNTSTLGIELLLGNYHPTLTMNLAFENVVPSALAAAFSDEPIFKTVDSSLSGTLSATVNPEGKLQAGSFNVKGGNGHIYTHLLPKPVAVDALSAEGDIVSEGVVNFKNIQLQLAKKTLTASGKVSYKDDDVAIDALIGATNIAASEVKLLWPEGVAPLTREWVTENITEGTVPDASVKLNIQFGDLAKPVLPREAVDAAINLKDATIRYLPEHPSVSKVNAVIRIDGISLYADISSADYMKATKLSTGKLTIDDLNLDNPYIKLSFDANTTAKDVVHLLRLPRLEHAKHLNLDSDTVDGTGTAHAELGFFFFTPKDEQGKPLADDGMVYSVQGEMKNITAPAFMNKFDIKNGDGKISVDTKQITFDGSGIVNGANAAHANVIYTFEPQDGYDTFIDVAATAPIDALPRFGYPAFAFLKGSLGVKAKVKLGDTMEDSEASIDLANSSVDVFGWSKQANVPATLDIKSEKRNGAVTIPSFKLSGENVSAAGSAALNKDLSEFQKISMENVSAGDTKLEHVLYEMGDNKLTIHLTGKSADLSSWWDNGEESSFSFETFPALDFKADVGKIVLSRLGSIGKLKGEMQCNARLCEKADVSGIIGDNKEFNFRILRNPKGKRQVSLRALDAGAFLKAFGAYPNIEGGELSLSGNYEDGAKSSVLRGRFIIDNYTVKKAPVLAKILALASFSGPLDLMQGNGITFSKLNAPFTLQNDVVTINKAKAYGGSIGITADGTVTFPKQTLDINGAVVPAYALNNIVGKIPLVGAILTGGDGGGLIAFNYSAKGSNSDPDVSVNPLSILTPGFLRGLFSGGDKDE